MWSNLPRSRRKGAHGSRLCVSMMQRSARRAVAVWDSKSTQEVLQGMRRTWSARSSLVSTTPPDSPAWASTRSPRKSASSTRRSCSRIMMMSTSSSISSTRNFSKHSKMAALCFSAGQKSVSCTSIPADRWDRRRTSGIQKSGCGRVIQSPKRHSRRSESPPSLSPSRMSVHLCRQE